MGQPMLNNKLPVGRFTRVAESPIVAGVTVRLRIISPSFNLEELKYL